MATIQGKTGEWEYVIGLEIHAQISSNSKLFSGSSTKFGAEPNSQVSFVDAAMPGMLPVINEYCIEQAVKTGLALNAQINKYSVFDRKNYFYADLPQGYQISQYLDPIVGKGSISIVLDGKEKVVGVTRIHMEQDAGKSLHDQNPRYSYIDLNRSGVALMEIVTEPDIRSPEEAAEVLKKLRTILRYIGTCDADLEKGMMRCDANVSVRKAGGQFGTRCEIKNLNSIRNVLRAIEHEAERQVGILENGGTIDQETRLYNADSNTTATMRSKEDAMDYRYFPDPDLLPLEFDDAFVERIRKTLPELPDQLKARYVKDLGLSEYDAGVLTAEQETTQFFEVAAKGHDAKLVCNWVTGELFARLNKANKNIDNSPISAKQVGDLVGLIENNTISGKIAKDVFDIMFETGQDAEKIVEEKGLKQVLDTGAIERAVDEVLAGNADKVAQYKGGQEKLFGFFVGQVMKAMQGKGNPQIINEILKKKLG
jgi:aspartyl-tRNA(Asn)/glutamyl-tRNA(Gln) amidotransferase subunit B